MKGFEYYKPSTLKEAVGLLKEHGETAEVLNGGTDLIVRMRDGHSAPGVVVDIKGIKELHELSIEEGRVFIGACVLLNDLGLHDVILKRYPYLSQASLSVGSKQVRNRATCIGNICNASPLADTATPLLALDAEIHIYGEKGIKTVPLSDFFVFVRKTILQPDEIVTGISFKDNANNLGIFYKMSRRKEVDLSTVCSTVVKNDDKYAISFGAVAPTPIRLPKTEAYLNENKLSEEVIEKACALALEEVSPISDVRATKEYRQEMVQVMLRNTLSEWL